MRAAWYEKQGPAAEVLHLGEMPDPQAGPGEVRVRVAVSGIHIGDIGKRQGYWARRPAASSSNSDDAAGGHGH